MILHVLFAISFIVNVTSILFLLRAINRMFQFDGLFETLVDDIDTNILYMEKLLATPLFTNSSEVMEMNKNIRIIRDRLEEFAIQMGDLTSRPRNPRPPVAS